MTKKVKDNKPRFCSSCGKELPITQFFVRSYNKHGVPIYYSRCKSCRKKITSFEKLRWQKSNRKLGIQLTQTIQINCYTINKLLRGQVVLLSHKSVAVEMLSWNKGEYVLRYRQPTDDEKNEVKRTTKSSDNIEMIESIRDSLELPQSVEDWTEDQWKVFREAAILWERKNYQGQE